MSLDRGLKAEEVALAVGLAVACAIAAVVVLVAATRPDAFEARLAAVGQEVDLAARLLRPKASLHAFPADAACSPALAEETERLRSGLASLAALSKLELTSVDVSQDASIPASGGLVPLVVRLEASGPYEAALGALSGLSTLRPVLFVDTVDLSSRTSAVNLVVSGRVYCAATP